MPRLARIPLGLRLPLIRTGLTLVAALRRIGWSSPVWRDDCRQGPLIVSGFTGEPLGVGRAAEASVAALRRAGFSPEVRSLRPAMGRLLHLRQPRLASRPGGVWLIHANAPETEIALMTHDAADWAQRYRIGYWAWETPVAPASWVRVAPWLHEIWTPSRFTAEALEAAFDRVGRPGLSAKLRVMPHPVVAPSDVRPAHAAFGLDARSRHALVVFDGRSAYARKNPWATLEAWTRAYPSPASDVALIVKAVNLEADPPSARRLRGLAASRPDVRLIEGELAGAEIWSLMATADVVVSTHRAEGFGLVPAEAMTLGKPVIATGWSAVTEFLDDESGILLPYRLVPVADRTGAYSGHLWADVDVEAAAAAIRSLLADPARATALGWKARERIRALGESWAPAALDEMRLGELAERSEPAPPRPAGGRGRSR